MSDITNSNNQGLPAFLVEFNALPKPTTYTDLLTCTSAKLRPFAAKYGNPALEAVISSVLIKLAGSLGKTIDGEHIAEVAEYIIDDFPDTKLSDFHLFKKQMLRGEIGGQVGDQLWQLNTRTLNLAWKEYYAKREDVFCEAREQKYLEDKKAYNDGFAKSFANATPEQQESHRQWVAKMEAVTEKKRIESEQAKEIIPAKLTLEEIAVSEGIDLTRLAEAIQKLAESEDPSVLMAVRLAGTMAKVTFEARQNPKYLHELVNLK